MAGPFWGLEPLLTVYEARSREAFIERLVVEIPIKLSSKAARHDIIRSSTGTASNSPSLNHLRRLVKHAHLPAKLQIPHRIEEGTESTIFLLLTDASAVSALGVSAALKPYTNGQEKLREPFWTRVPCVAPTTTEQAALWSEQYWPCVYNPASQTLQDAPPLQLLRATKVEIESGRLLAYFRLAWLSARESGDAQAGRASAAVAIDPVTAKVVAVAGDARWWPFIEGVSEGPFRPSNEGRAEHHALMRVIAQVANRELQQRNTENGAQSKVEVNSANPHSAAITPVEKYYSDNCLNSTASIEQAQDLPERQLTARAGAYLCNGLDLYLTHEPCVSCSMAMVHSRFRACIFEKSMPATGGLQAEKLRGALGYGLFWRRELNWRVMAFRFENRTDLQREQVGQPVFHA